MKTNIIDLKFKNLVFILYNFKLIVIPNKSI